mmetsp:Transcript_10355/g.30732  ORF Transcript_10355/g.30732 Transcript_10355/m.30732 type:complete len:275 (+) Transcript_10355:180-1004(+)
MMPIARAVVLAAALCQSAAAFAGPATRGPALARLQTSSKLPSVAVEVRMADEPVKEVPFEVRGFSYSTVTLGAAVAITLYSFVQFFLNDGEASSSLGFVYGFPGLLLGAALKYAEVDPVPVESAPGAEALRESRANVNLQKIYSDVTRYRYADAHLEDALKVLGLQPRGEGPPELLRLVESVVDGEYAMELVFASKATPYNNWLRNAHRYANFFGPNVRATVRKVSAERREVALGLITVPDGGDLTPMEIQEDGSAKVIKLDGSIEGKEEAVEA